MNINEIKIKKKNFLQRIMDVFDVSTHAWQFVVLTRVLSERRQKPLAGRTGSLLYSSGFKKSLLLCFLNLQIRRILRQRRSAQDVYRHRCNTSIFDGF